MKLLFTLFSILFFSIAKTQYESPKIIDSNFAAYISNIEFADLDNDNKKDIVIGYFSDSIRWYKNNGNFSFTKMPKIGTGLRNPRHYDIADIDGNGFKDIIVSSDGSTNKLVLFKNNGGGTNWTEVLIDNNITLSIVNSYFADMDKDGDLDIISCHDLMISVYYNNGVGVFSGRNSVSGTANNEFYNLKVKDFNGDGFLDFIVNSAIGVELYKNNQNNTYTKTLLFDKIHEFLESCDIDNDGDFDYFIPDNLTLSDVNTYKNDGTGIFNFNQSVFYQTSLQSNPPLKYVKLNNDNFFDVLYRFVPKKGIYLRLNDGFGNLQSTVTLIDSVFNYTYSNAIDLNDDNKTAIVWFAPVGGLNGVKYFGFTKNISIVTNIQNSELLPKISIFPNPIHNILYFKNLNKIKVKTINIFDVLGKVVYNSKKLPMQINTSNWAAGYYTIKINNIITKMIKL